MSSVYLLKEGPIHILSLENQLTFGLLVFNVKMHATRLYEVPCASEIPL